MEEKKVTFPVTLGTRGREIVDGAKAEFGVSRTELVTRLLEWYARQHKSVRRELIDKAGDPLSALTNLVRPKKQPEEGETTGEASLESWDELSELARALNERVKEIKSSLEEKQRREGEPDSSHGGDNVTGPTPIRGTKPTPMPPKRPRG